jgi:HPt (histidine-containing phosphotransfer) domain-containing protein
MDGFEATVAIRKLEKDSGRHTPIIAMTAHALSGHREQCLEAGMDDYVAKPVRPEDLFDAIERQLTTIGTGGRRLEAVGSAGEAVGGETVGCKLARPMVSSLKLTASGDTPPIFDRAGLETRLGGDKELAEEIVAVFMADFPKQIERLRQALRDSDLPTAHRIAHSIKGAAASIGAERLRAVALQAEEQVRSRAFDAAHALTERMETAFEELRAVIADCGL